MIIINLFKEKEMRFCIFASLLILSSVVCLGEYIQYFEPGISKLYKETITQDVLDNVEFAEYKYYELICTGIEKGMDSGDIHYQLIYRIYYEYPDNYHDTCYYYDLYYADGKVFTYLDNHKMILIDFSLNKGDCIKQKDFCTLSDSELLEYEIYFTPMYIYDTGKIDIDGIKRRALKLAMINASWNAVDYMWVEGIGPKYLDDILPRDIVVPTCNHTIEFVACYKDGECIFTAEDFDKYVSDYEINNPGVGITDAETDSEEESSTKWYTIQGIRVMPPLAPGLYIRRCDNRTEKLLLH